MIGNLQITENCLQRYLNAQFIQLIFPLPLQYHFGSKGSTALAFTLSATSAYLKAATCQSFPPP